MNRKIFFIVLFTGAVVLQLSCAVVTTPGYDQRLGSSGLAKEGLLHSYKMAQECVQFAQANPNAEVDCRFDTDEFVLTSDPRFAAPATAPVTGTNHGSTHRPPPVIPGAHTGPITNSSGYPKLVTIFTQNNGHRTIYAGGPFTLNPGQSKTVSLNAGNYMLRIEGEPERLDTTLTVNEGFTYTITR
ncbi:hypothetical protein ACFL2U_00300 [Patescibacteria group bacterium]